MTPEHKEAGEIARPVPKDWVEHCPGGYVMHFYCKYDNPTHPFQSQNPGNYMEEPDQVETRGQAIAQMRRAGWIYHRDNTATCPRCAAALRALANQPEDKSQ